MDDCVVKLKRARGIGDGARSFFILVLFSNIAFCQMRPATNITAGLLIGTENTVGFHLQSSIFYFQTKFSTQHRPGKNDYDHTHTHNVGLALRITNKIEVLNGAGYNSMWNGYDKRLDWHYNFGMAFRDEVVKVMIYTDFNHEYGIGLLFNFR